MKNRRLKDSFRNASSGIIQAFKTESNIKRHCVSGTFALILAIILKFDRIEWVLLLIIISIVFITEILNTAVEYSIDMVCGNSYNEIAKYAKDIAAGATLIAAFGAFITGIILYLPKVIYLFQLKI